MSESAHSSSLAAEQVLAAFFNVIILPIAKDPQIVEPHLDAIAAITKIDKFTLRQRYLGTSVTVLKRAPERKDLDELAAKLSTAGYPAAVVSDEAFHAIEAPRRAVSVTRNKDSITFMAGSGEPAGTIERGNKVLILLADLKAGEKGMGIPSLSMKGAPEKNPDRTIRGIARGIAVIDIYSTAWKGPVRVFGSSFNYLSLGEEATMSQVRNFHLLIETIRDVSGRSRIDLDFFEGAAPQIRRPESLDCPVDFKSEERRKFNAFDRYSRLIHLADQAGIFRGEKAVRRRQREFSAAITTGTDELAPGASRVEPPSAFSPIEPTSRFRAAMNRPLEAIRSLGPPRFFVPLIAVGVASAAIGIQYRLVWAMPTSWLCLGIGVFVHGLYILSRARRIENTPTAKVRSVAMGLVEVAGKARQKYILKAPYSNVDCVYYRYKVVDYEQVGDQRSRMVVAAGDSGRVPFYLEDDTGSILVKPDGAVIDGIIDQSFQHPGEMMSLEMKIRATGQGQTVYESLIPVGYSLYAIGTAQRRADEPQARKQELVGRLRKIKHSPEAMAAYDTNNDGVVDAEEWEQAREDVEKTFLKETLEGADDPDDVFIGKDGDDNRPFLITNRSEKVLVNGLKIKSTLFIVGGGILSAVISAIIIAGFFPGPGI